LKHKATIKTILQALRWCNLFYKRL